MAELLEATRYPRFDAKSEFCFLNDELPESGEDSVKESTEATGDQPSGDGTEPGEGDSAGPEESDKQTAGKVAKLKST